MGSFLTSTVIATLLITVCAGMGTTTESTTEAVAVQQQQPERTNHSSLRGGRTAWDVIDARDLDAVDEEDYAVDDGYYAGDYYGDDADDYAGDDAGDDAVDDDDAV